MHCYKETESVRTLAIANQKGGVGKTTTTHALGIALADKGYRVLLVDLDPQGTLTWACGVRETTFGARGTPARTLASIMDSDPPDVASLPGVIRPVVRRLSVLVSDNALVATQAKLSARHGREKVLQSILNVLSGYYHLCLIDCPPSMGLLTLNALVCANAVLIPTQPLVADLAALPPFIQMINSVRQTYNPGLQLMGILVTFYDRRLIHHAEMLRSLEATRLPVMRTTIRRGIRVAESVGLSQSILTYAPQNPEAEDYRNLADEVVPWADGRMIRRDGAGRQFGR